MVGDTSATESRSVGDRDTGSRDPGRLLPLDGLRGVAAMSVVAYHYLSNSSRVYPEQLGDRVPGLSWGRQGVVLFFVISGFVIALSLQSSTPRQFVVARLCRLYPIYWVCLVLTFAGVTVLGLPGREVGVATAISNVAMFHSLLGLGNVDGVYWTLGVELVFYVMAASVWYGGLLTARRLPGTLYSWLLCVTAAGVALENSVFAWFRVAENLPYFLVGVAALAIVQGDTRWSIRTFPLFAISSGALFDWRPAVAAAVALALVVGSLRWRPWGLASNPLLFLGWLSYPLYLIHQNLGYAALLRLQAAGVPRALAACLTMVVAVTAAAALTRFVDEPLRRLSRRLLSPLAGPGSPVKAGRGS